MKENENDPLPAAAASPQPCESLYSDSYIANELRGVERLARGDSRESAWLLIVNTLSELAAALERRKTGDMLRAASQSDPLPTAASGPQLRKEVLAMLGEFADNPEILFYDSTLCWYCCGPYALNAHEPGCLVVRARVACGLPIHYEEGRGYVEKGGRLPDAAGKVVDTATTETPEGLK